MIVVNFDPVDNNIFTLVDRSIVINFGSAGPDSGGNLKSDGSVEMDAGYTPAADQEIPTKKYVDDNAAAGAGNLKSDGTVPMDGGYTPAVDQALGTKKYTDDGLAGKADLVGGVVPTSQIPAMAISEYLGAVASEVLMLALVGQLGDWCTRTDVAKTYIITGPNPTLISDWTSVSYPAAPVDTVNGQAGTVVLAKDDIGLGNVDNTSDASKPVSSPQQTALNLKLAIANFKEEGMSGTRLTDAAVTGSKALDWNAYKVFEFTLTGNTTITDSNLPTGTETKVINMIITGDFTLAFPVYYEEIPGNDSYDGTKRNLLVINCVNGTGASEDVTYSLQNLAT